MVDGNTDPKENNNRLDYLICPKCYKDFIRLDSQLTCPVCNQIYSIVDDVPLITEGERYFYDFEFTKEIMNQMIHCAINGNPATTLDKQEEEYGWQYALRVSKTQGRDRISDYAIRYSTDERRAGWKYLLPITKQSVVLDFGCGLGSVSCNIARDAGQVISLDSTYERVKFTHIRSKQLGFQNVIPVCLNTKSTKLPFRDDFFDVVIVNGVLEWVPSSVEKGSPYKVQRDQLKEIYRVLKPKGVLYLGIENRYGWSYWRGQRDHHTGLRFVTLMPRFLANGYSYIAKRTPFRNHTHSWKGYHQILEQAGFGKVKIFLPFPTYANFKYIIDSSDRISMEYILTHSRIHGLFLYLTRQFLKTGWYKYIWYSYSIVSKKTELNEAF